MNIPLNTQSGSTSECTISAQIRSATQKVAPERTGAHGWNRARVSPSTPLFVGSTSTSRRTTLSLKRSLFFNRMTGTGCDAMARAVRNNIKNKTPLKLNCAPNDTVKKCYASLTALFPQTSLITTANVNDIFGRLASNSLCSKSTLSSASVLTTLQDQWAELDYGKHMVLPLNKVVNEQDPDVKKFRPSLKVQVDRMPPPEVSWTENSSSILAWIQSYITALATLYPVFVVSLEAPSLLQNKISAAIRAKFPNSSTVQERIVSNTHRSYLVKGKNWRAAAAAQRVDEIITVVCTELSDLLQSEKSARQRTEIQRSEANRAQLMEAVFSPSTWLMVAAGGVAMRWVGPKVIKALIQSFKNVWDTLKEERELRKAIPKFGEDVQTINAAHAQLRNDAESASANVREQIATLSSKTDEVRRLHAESQNALAQQLAHFKTIISPEDREKLYARALEPEVLRDQISAWRNVGANNNRVRKNVGMIFKNNQIPEDEWERRFAELDLQLAPEVEPTES